MKEYIKDHPMKKDNTVFWIMGHSRGGAVVNLVSKKMGDLGYNTYTYTFATPNVTTDTGAEIKVIAEIVKNFGNVSATRNGCYVYTCKCHSPNKKEVGKSIQTKISSGGTEQMVREKYDSLPKELKESCKFSAEKGVTASFDGYLCKSPMYFMNQLAIVMGGNLVTGLKFMANDAPDRYEDAKFSILNNRNSIKHPHFADAYIVLSE